MSVLETIICPNCMTENLNGHRCCSHCGRKLRFSDEVSDDGRAAYTSMCLILGKNDAESGAHQAALYHYNEAIRIMPNYAEAYYHRGHAYADLKQYDAAICDYGTALKANPLMVFTKPIKV